MPKVVQTSPQTSTDVGRNAVTDDDDKSDETRHKDDEKSSETSSYWIGNVDSGQTSPRTLSDSERTAKVRELCICIYTGIANPFFFRRGEEVGR